MSDNKKIIDFDEKKLKYENVFSIPIVQYQTTNTEEMNKELKRIILKSFILISVYIWNFKS